MRRACGLRALGRSTVNAVGAVSEVCRYGIHLISGPSGSVGQGGSLGVRAIGAARRSSQMKERRAAAFELERVTVVRAGRRVLDGVTAWFPAVGITVVSGPSGAGKTTLLRLCNRLEVPDEGRVCYRGQPGPADRSVHGHAPSAGAPVRCPSRNW